MPSSQRAGKAQGFCTHRNYQLTVECDLPSSILHCFALHEAVGGTLYTYSRLKNESTTFFFFLKIFLRGANLVRRNHPGAVAEEGSPKPYIPHAQARDG